MIVVWFLLMAAVVGRVGEEGIWRDLLRSCQRLITTAQILWEGNINVIKAHGPLEW